MPQATSSKPLHIFKPGVHVTVGGESIAFGEADLQATAAAYDPKKSKAPLVKGHPAIDAPAQGWAAALAATERGLFAVPEKVDPAFAEEVRAGRYGTVSAKFYRPTSPNNPVPGVWYLRHIGFLGAQPPAVKGLDEPAFAEDEEGCVCFAEGFAFGRDAGAAFGEWDGMTTATLWRQLREWIVGKFGLDEADRVLPGHSVRDLELSAAERLNQERAAVAAFAEAPATPSPSPQPQESTVTDEEAARLREQNEAQARQIADLQARDAERQRAAVLADNTAFAEELAREMRIPTGQAPLVAAALSQLQTSAEVSFGEGEAKKPLHQAVRDLFAAMPKRAGSGEQATRERAATGQDGADADPAFAEADPQRMAQHKQAQAYAREHGVPYATAAAAVIK